MLNKICLTRANHHEIMLVNDRGPQYLDIEKKILSAIEGHSNFRYYLNDENMGFVKTCNRAVMELDRTDNDILLLNSDTKVTKGFLEEMLEVLYFSEKHGAVCPRSNNATILSVPFQYNGKQEISSEDSYQLFLQMKDKMSRYSVLPTGVGFAILIKRDLIKKFGLFDEAYSPGYNEENDFCMRINQYGYNTIMANRAFVFHFESKSFGERRNRLEKEHHELLVEKYPYYDKLTNAYRNHSVKPMDYYMDLAAEGFYHKRRILFSLYEIPAAFNGTAQYGLAILESFFNAYKDKYDISVLINHAADKFHKISEKYERVYYPDNVSCYTFHLAFSPSQIFNIEHLIILNRVCLKYVFCMQDIISIRSAYLLTEDEERLEVFRKSIAYCDGMISISEFSLKDTRDFYYDEFSERTVLTKVIYHGMNNDVFEVEHKKLPFEKYVMVFGSFYKHKFLSETMKYLQNIDCNFIVLGTEDERSYRNNIYGYRSGGLSDEFVNELISNAVAILFPSIYEGFGLPLLSAIKFNKKIIMMDNELNRELKGYFEDYSDNILLFQELEEISEYVWQVVDSSECKKGSLRYRSWGDAADELESFLDEVLNAPIDGKRLQNRWNDIRYIESVHRMYVQNAAKTSMPMKIKLYVYNKHPIAYKFLKGIKKVLE